MWMSHNLMSSSCVLFRMSPCSIRSGTTWWSFSSGGGMSLRRWCVILPFVVSGVKPCRVRVNSMCWALWLLGDGLNVQLTMQPMSNLVKGELVPRMWSNVTRCGGSTITLGNMVSVRVDTFNRRPCYAVLKVTYYFEKEISTTLSNVMKSIFSLFEN